MKPKGPRGTVPRLNPNPQVSLFKYISPEDDLHPWAAILLCSFVSQHENLIIFLLSLRLCVCAFLICRVYMIYLKLALVLVYAFGRSNLDDQAVIFWGVITCWSVWSCTHLPYRCRSSNR